MWRPGATRCRVADRVRDGDAEAQGSRGAGGRGCRPSDYEGELHGLYEPNEDEPPPLVSVCMKTAQRKQVVASRSFVRTVVHEFLHHLDYEHFELEETFHTEGFYKRESSLSNAIFAAAGYPPPEPKPRRMR